MMLEPEELSHLSSSKEWEPALVVLSIIQQEVGSRGFVLSIVKQGDVHSAEYVYTGPQSKTTSRALQRRGSYMNAQYVEIWVLCRTCYFKYACVESLRSSLGRTLNDLLHVMEIPQAVDYLLVPIRAHPYFLNSESAHDFHNGYTSNRTYASSTYRSTDLHNLPTTNDSIGDGSLGFTGVSGVGSYEGFANPQCVLSTPPANPAYLPRPNFISDSHQSSLDSRYARYVASCTFILCLSHT